VLVRFDHGAIEVQNRRRPGEIRSVRKRALALNRDVLDLNRITWAQQGNSYVTTVFV
jgi:hypothetical protein